MSNDKMYNGWTNWATWNINLWVMNEELLHRFVEANKPYDAQDAENMCREHIFPEGTPDMEMKDLDDVNWQEVADAWNEE